MTPRHGTIRTVALLACSAMLLPGCVDRRLRITSEPPGALVHVNDVELGRTPLDADFTHYGVYDVRVELDGHEPLLTSRKASAPLWEYPVVDLVAIAAPARFENVVEWHFDLEPSVERTMPPEQLDAELVARAQELRSRLTPSDDPADD